MTIPSTHLQNKQTKIKNKIQSFSQMMPYLLNVSIQAEKVEDPRTVHLQLMQPTNHDN